MKMLLSAPCSVGEVYDKITILEIKQRKISEITKLDNINKEHGLLCELVKDINRTDAMTSCIEELANINEELWDIEDEIRELEKKSDFNDRFIELARNVYLTNDRRSAVKKKINIMTGSAVIEEKSYDHL